VSISSTPNPSSQEEGNAYGENLSQEEGNTYGEDLSQKEENAYGECSGECSRECPKGILERISEYFEMKDYFFLRGLRMAQPSSEKSGSGPRRS